VIATENGNELTSNAGWWRNLEPGKVEISGQPARRRRRYSSSDAANFLKRDVKNADRY
jgi:hypothetical protein